MGYPQDTKDTSKKYAKFLKDKKVCVVGPAPHVVGLGQAERIDSYDIVVRINKGYVIPEEYRQDMGERRDVIYQTCMPKNTLGTLMPIDELEKDVKWICCSSPDKKHKQKIKDFIKYVDDRIDIHIINQKKWIGWTKRLSDTSVGSSFITPGIPQTGTAAIFDLLQYDIRELYVTGMTFFQKRDKDRSVYYPGYFPSEKRPNLKYTKHHFRQEFKCFRSLCEKDKRIQCDKILRKLIKR